jgi:hypothetical protein
MTVPSTEPRTVRPEPPNRPEPKKRPDPRPMRLAIGASAMAAVSVMSVGLVRFPATAPAADAVSDPGPTTVMADVKINHVIQYVHLKPGQKAPAGAKVITPNAPAPRVIVTRASAPVLAPQRQVIVRTRQSGHP